MSLLSRNENPLHVFRALVSWTNIISGFSLSTNFWATILGT